ncbi:MAG: GYD domain-containing protein [Candidatus Thermoplasmatota archaeon]|jgi:uncharacterized protein with GYD domain|nr:GYD domain-containing protein [Candidatus Thermoplasmatota archaeon]MED6305928.1 GYD domain-containing protein [Candidatus Thermoplasmatota archaeon]
MSKFMYSGNYTKRGIKGLLKEGGTARRDETVRIVEALGGKVEAYYWCYGSTDFLTIMDFPDHTTVTGMALNIAASGSFEGNLTPLISVEEMDEMVKVSVGDWRAPGD